MNIVKGKIRQPAKVVLYGAEGVGKSSLCASIKPRPLLLDTEKGSRHIEVDRVDVKDWRDLKQIYMEVLSLKKRNELPYQTIVIDSIERLEEMLIEYVCSTNQKNNIEDWGYGKGYVYLKQSFTKFLASLDALCDVGLNLVIVGHSEVKRVNDPLLGDYDRHEIRLTRQNAPVLKEWANEILFMRFHTLIKEGEGFAKSRAIGGKKRLLCCQHHPAFDAKSRAGLDAEVPAEFGSIKHIFQIGKEKGSK